MAVILLSTARGILVRYGTLSCRKHNSKAFDVDCLCELAFLLFALLYFLLVTISYGNYRYVCRFVLDINISSNVQIYDSYHLA